MKNSKTGQNELLERYSSFTLEEIRGNDPINLIEPGCINLLEPGCITEG